MSIARDKANSTVSNFASTGIDDNADANAITIDSSERIGLNKTPDSSVGTVGVEVSTAGQTLVTTDNSTPLFINRKSSDGDIIDIRQAGSSIGSIGTNGDRLYFTTANKGFFVDESGSDIVPSNGTGGNTNNIMNLGNSASAFKDLYLGGNLYIGGTGSANALDDYEEGEFNIDVASSNATVNTSQDRCRYTKIGRMVYVSGTIKFSSFTSSTDNIQITGLPFTTASNVSGGEAYGHLSVMLNNIDGGNAGNQFLLSFSSTGGDLYAFAESGSLNTVRTSALGSGSEIYFQGWYTAA